MWGHTLGVSSLANAFRGNTSSCHVIVDLLVFNQEFRIYSLCIDVLFCQRFAITKIGGLTLFKIQEFRLLCNLVVKGRGRNTVSYAQVKEDSRSVLRGFSIKFKS